MATGMDWAVIMVDDTGNILPVMAIHRMAMATIPISHIILHIILGITSRAIIHTIQAIIEVSK